ncbi:MAG: hypothetical protein IB617_00915 [Candidatus Nealsonbacteria bacterium]|nr:MAG: hypothetical protein IB617_00915 [Candidatus Nealsonbacteria bacterium]
MNVRNKLKYLFLIITIGSLLLPKPTLAFIGTGVFDFFSTALGGIEEISGPVAKMLFIVLMAYIIGIVCLYTSASLLELVIENPGWLSLSGNTMVKSGWDIISGLSNMFFILVFIIITLAIILKIESSEAKKLLPKLLIVALLVNFSLVFIGILVDISTIFYNTILTEENEGLPTKAINILGVDGQNIVEQIITQIIALAVAFVVPIFGPFAQLGLVLGIITLGYISNIIIWIVQSICFFMMSGIFFTYAFLFAARIYIIQLLAMLAPLAFLCSVLPQTKKYWDEWLKTIVEWIFLGIILFLFLVLGLRAADSLLPSEGITSIPLLAWGNLPAYFPYYFFLFVYLTTTLWLSKKYMPELAGAMIEQGKAWGGMVWSRGLKPLGRAAQPAAEKVGEAVGKRVGGRLAGWGEKQRITGVEKSKKLEEKKGAKAWFSRRGRGWQRRIGTGAEITGRGIAAGIEESKIRRIEELKEKTKGKTEQTQFFELQKALTQKLPEEALGITEAMIEDNTLEKAEKAGIFGDKEHKELVRRSKELGRKTIYNYKPDIAAPIVEKEKWERAESLIKKGGMLKEEGSDEEGNKLIKEGEESKKEILSDMLKGIKPSQVAQISEESLKNNKIKEAIIDSFTGSQMAEIGRNFEVDTVEGIQRKIDKIEDFEEFAEKNPSLTLWLHGNAAQNLGFRSPTSIVGLPRDDLRKRVADTRVSAEKTRSDKKEKIKIKYFPGKEVMMFKDYYRKDTLNTTKSFIKEIVAKKGKTIPLETEVKRRIGKFEKEYDKLNKEWWKTWKNFKEIRDEYQSADSPTDEQEQAFQKAKSDIEKKKTKIDETQAKLIESEQNALKDLW